MTPFASLADLPSHLHQPAVRDLAWALLSPPLLQQPPCPQRHPLSDSRWTGEPGLLADWLLQQDAQPQALHDWLAQRPTRRLGLYYERLWQFALQAAPGVEVLAANLPIRQAGHTLGELDLLLRDTSGVHHLELAIKLYLGLSTGPAEQPAQWIGPGSHDRLELKLAHLYEHQLPLTERQQAQPMLRALTDQPIRSAMWLGGYLFYPWHATCPAPAGVAAEHLRGRWLHRRDWPALQASQQDGHWQVLPRQSWLAPARLAATDLCPAQPPGACTSAQPGPAAAQLLVHLLPDATGHWIEQQRVFVVADDWPATTIEPH